VQELETYMNLISDFSKKMTVNRLTYVTG